MLVGHAADINLDSEAERGLDFMVCFVSADMSRASGGADDDMVIRADKRTWRCFC